MPAKRPPPREAMIVAMEENDWLIPIIRPWISLGACKETLAKVLVQVRAAINTATLKWIEKEM